MSRIFTWVKTHKLTFVLILIVLYFIYKNFSSTYIIPPYSRVGGYDTGLGLKGAPGINSMMRSDIIPPIQEAPPTTDVTNRLVMRESYLSLLVKSVVEAQKQIIQTAKFNFR